MNLKNPRELALRLREIDLDVTLLHKERSAGMLSDRRFFERAITKYARGFAMLAEYIDPEMEPEDLESFKPGKRSEASAPRASDAIEHAERMAAEYREAGDVRVAAQLEDLVERMRLGR